MIRPAATVLLLSCSLGCKASLSTGAERGTVASSIDLKGTGNERCDGSKPEREVSEYDTGGDARNDVRKVFVALGDDEEARLVLICRESDINFDGRKDVVRYYDDEGRSLREEQDRDFDSRMDLVLVFQDGEPMVKEIDENRDGKIDTKVFLEKGLPVRAERDLKGRSTPDTWRPDRWEYYEEGRMVRMGTDLDGDARVDRWDRDHEHKGKEDTSGSPLNPAEDEPTGPPAPVPTQPTAPPPSKS